MEQSDAHISQDYDDNDDEEEEADQGEQGQREQPNYDERFAHLEGKMLELKVAMDDRFNAVDERLNVFDGWFNSIDEGLAAFLACLGPQ